MTKQSENSPLKKIKKKVLEMSFEEAMKRLEEITETLSSQKISLESMVILYEEGTELKKHCLTMLEEAKIRVDTIG